MTCKICGAAINLHTKKQLCDVCYIKEWHNQHPERGTRYRDKRKAKKAVYDKKFRQKNCKYIKTIHKEYYQQNREVLLQQMKDDYNPEKRSAYDREYHQRPEVKERINKRLKVYRQTPNGKEVIKRVAYKRRNMNWIKLMDNPFPAEIKVEWHHVHNWFVLPLPYITHMKYNHGRNVKMHRKVLDTVIKKIYGLNMNALLRG